MKPVTVALLGAALCAPLASAQLEPVEVQSGRISLHILDGALEAHGLVLQDLEVTAESGTPAEEFVAGDLMSFAIAGGADLKVLRDRQQETFQPYGVLGGAAPVSGGFTLVSPSTGRSVDFHEFVMHAEDVRTDGPGGEPDPDYFFISSAADPDAGDFLIWCVKILFSPDEGYEAEGQGSGHHGMPDLLRIKSWDLVISPVLAAKLDRPDLAGQALGYGKLDADVAVYEGEWEHPQGQNVFTPQQGEQPGGGFEGSLLDVKLGILNGITDQGHVGTFPNGRVGLSMATTSCNVGDVNVTWLAAMNEDHPGIAMQMYREMGDRFEQVAVSWIKHGFFALSNSQCTQCQNPSPGTFLGVGCSDTYGASNNGDRFWLGPRDEWDAFNNTWTCLGSYFDGSPVDCERDETGSGNGPVDHRLEGFDYDFDLPGATYYYEAMYLVAGDQDKKNNIGSRKATMSWNGFSWNTGTASGDNPLTEGPTIWRWEAADDSRTVGLGADDGEVILSVNTVDLGNGLWRYEYALFNWTLDRKVRSFSVPSGGLVSDFYFHDIDDQLANDWVVTTDGKNVTWTFPDVFLPGHKVAGPLEFGTLYNFGFTSNKAPAKRIAELGIHEPGDGGDLLGADILAPSALAISSTDLAPAEGETPNLIVRGGSAGALMAVLAVNGVTIPPLVLTPVPVPFVGDEAAFPLNIPVGVSGLEFDLVGADYDTAVIELSNIGRIKVQ